MRTRDNYWVRRLNSSRLSRRRFVGTAGAAGAGAAGLALVGCGDDDDDGGASPTTATGNGATPTASSDGEEPTPTTAPDGNGGPMQGGVARFSSANNTWDLFDADRSRFTPFAYILGLTNLGIVHYENFAEARLEGGWAESWEFPDETTMTFTMRDGLLWHDKPPVDGRAARVEDMQFFIERNKSGTLVDGTEDPSFWRKSDYDTVNTVEAVDERTLRVTFTQPNPFFLPTLAGSYAKVQAPEAVEAFEDVYSDLDGVAHIIGTGPFVMTEFDPDGDYSVRRFEDYWRPANWDGVDFVALFVDQAAQQAAFEQKQIDSYSPASNAVFEDLMTRYDGQIFNTPSVAANPQAGTYYGGAPPWSDERLIGAIFRAVDRHDYLARIIEGRGFLSANVPPAQGAFGITERELITFPGYKPPDQRDEDIADARQMWEAGDGASLGEIIIDVPDLYEGVYSGFAEYIQGMLNEVLQTDQFTPRVETYAVISNKVTNAEYGGGRNNVWWGWISDLQKLEPTPDLHRLYASNGASHFQFGVTIPEVDQLLEDALVELDVDRRIEATQEVTRHLIQHNGAGIPHTLLQFSNVLRWNYFHPPEAAAFVGAHQWAKDAWFDMTDPTWRGGST